MDKTLEDLIKIIERVNKQLANKDVLWNIKIFHLREKANAFDAIGNAITSGEVTAKEIIKHFPKYTSVGIFMVKALEWYCYCGDWPKAADLSQKIFEGNFRVSLYTRTLIKESILRAIGVAQEFHDSECEKKFSELHNRLELRGFF